MAQQPGEWQQVKRRIRAEARAKRRKQAGRGPLSRQICRRLAGLGEYVHAATVMFYVDIRCEVCTRRFLPAVWRDGKRIVVPYCQRERIELFYLEGLDELSPGTMQIPEPKAELRDREDRKADVSRVDLIVVPGVAFDRRGGRLGQGKGYYDRLLRRVGPDTALIAPAFECQLLPEVPMLPHDVYVHKLVTEKAVYDCRSGLSQQA